MTKILVLKADEIEHELTIEDARFVFILTRDKVFHIDLTDQDMWIAKENLSDLGKGHKKLVKAKRIEINKKKGG